jgi:NhaP-type Na+/H+ or K+/H+ antiporter
MDALKLNDGYSLVLTAFFMVLVLDTVMTFTMTSILTGWTEGFLRRLAGGWLLGFAVGFPTSLLITPVIRRLVKKVCNPQA